MQEVRRQRTEVGSEAFEFPGPRTKYEEIEIGKEYGPIEWVVSPELIDRQLVITQDYHDWYVGDSPFGGRIAPMFINNRAVRRFVSDVLNLRGLFYQYECENLNPVFPNQRLFLTAKVIEKWQKRGREFVKYEATCVDEEGLPIFRYRAAHVLHNIDDSGKVKEYPGQRPIRHMAEGVSKVDRDTPVGHQLPAMAMDHSFWAMIAYEIASFISPRNIHTDQAAAEAEGLPCPVGTGPHFASLIQRMMIYSFEEGWVRGGKISVKFVRPAFPGELLTARGVVRGKEPEGTGVRLICDVWVENQQGEKLVVGEASGLAF